MAVRNPSGGVRFIRAVQRPSLSTARANRREWQPALIQRAWLTDCVVIVLAVAVAQAIRFGELSATPVDLNYSVLSLILALLWMGALATHGTRNPRIFGAGPEEYGLILSATLRLFGVIAILSLLFRADIARGYLAIAFPVGLVGLLLSRWLGRRAMGRRRANGEIQTSVLLVGSRRAVVDVAQLFERRVEFGHRVVGVCVPGHVGRPGEHIVVDGHSIPIYGDEEAIIAAVEASGADTVAVTATEELGHAGLRQLVWALEPHDVDLVVSSGVVDIAGPRLMMRPVAGLPLIHVAKPTYERSKRLHKAAFDVTFAVLALLAVAPLLLLTALAIKLTSPGPVLYRSQRVGVDGRDFTMLKFRSMVVGADAKMSDLMARNEAAGTLFKLHDDPRVTKVGKVIRRFSIDELLQFVNVLRREMSVVGPRPPLRRELDGYGGEVHRRMLVKPGVTGLWQVSGRSDLSWEETIRLDLSYVENWSMASDLVIIAKTLRAVVGGRGAY